MLRDIAGIGVVGGAAVGDLAALAVIEFSKVPARLERGMMTTWKITGEVLAAKFVPPA